MSISRKQAMRYLRTRRPVRASVGETQECPYCEGDGAVFGGGGNAETGPDEITCPECCGSGYVEDDESVDLDKTLYDYAEEIVGMSEDAEFEAEREKGWD